MLRVYEKVSSVVYESSLRTIVLFFCCDRSVYFTYESTVKVKGIKLYRFIAPKELYLSGDVYEANKGFCVPSNSCLPTGLLNISRCQPQSKLSLLALFTIKCLIKSLRESSEIFCPSLVPWFSLFLSASSWSPGNEKDETTCFRGS